MSHKKYLSSLAIPIAVIVYGGILKPLHFSGNSVLHETLFWNKGALAFLKDSVANALGLQTS